MNQRQLHALSLRGTDVTGALYRLSGREAAYLSFLRDFLNDPTMEELEKAVAAEAWERALIASSALKGAAGNMGFVPLMDSVSRLSSLIRGGRMKEVSRCLLQVSSSYRDIVDAIQECLRNTNDAEEEEA